MLFLPAAALCCLCSALVAMAADLIQEDLTWTRRVGETVSFSCRGTDQCDRDNVFWYQKKDTETFTRILDINRSNGRVFSGYNHPQEDDFSALRKQKGCELVITNIKLLHSATYYCSCWKYLIFGSGTKLFVTDKQVVKPVVSVYPAASRENHEGKSSLLCVASNMFPPVVRFSWKRRKVNGPLEELPLAEGERNSGCTAAIRVIDRDALYTYKYLCNVQHEGGKVEAQTEQEISAPPTLPPLPPPTLPPFIPPSPPPAAPVQSWHRERLLCLMYTALIVKSLVYCCGLSLLRILRNKGPSTDLTQVTD
ncbi:immunoglobulin lambda-1 light chain-like [Micropterus salmoides]|uniref:immunoglobulin lambda-1 light chain-like n=1 Tax=Micropterus salmoides TaxID=27706 RepID=UPI0018ED848A|nr:immunoglobulin lambda-1 light chain-like [Micropterus salmoides]